ncbi:hypothetical protein [Amycolatopsis sp. 195334CR]|uniref:hypothetical protein n=1 Tax=Amycolatopsis sp. 195334CR TaxID=2814588 RepID=UPI001A8C148F|nr:hypothetical protein [Amycolatopsis sp. 195334CR]MBN6035714.1 hypothetical protein [Amycolatopsis sp. 195334CR]
MTTTATRVRIPGRPRFGGVFAGDTTSFLVVFGLGALGTAFGKLPWWREVLLGTGSAVDTVDPSVPAALVLVLSGLAARAQLRRGYRWADPAELTWLAVDRVPVLGARVWRVWLGWLLAVGYATTLGAAVYRAPVETWIAAGLLLAGSSALTLAVARRPVETGVAAGPIALAGAGVVVALTSPPPEVLSASGVVLLLVAAVFAWGSGSPLRPVAARIAGRVELVAAWRERVVRLVAVSFLDPLLMLPAARPVAVRVTSIWGLALAGVLGRRRYAVNAVLLAVAAGVARFAFPALPEVAVVAVAAYAALMPFGGGLGELWRGPGLRRWIDEPDRRIRAAFALVFGGLVLAWAAVLALVVAVLGVPVGPAAWAVLPLAAAAVLRTASRPPISYDNIGVTDTPFGQTPVRLITQAVRGPDLAVLGALLLSVSPFGPVVLGVILVLTTWSCLR